MRRFAGSSHPMVYPERLGHLNFLEDVSLAPGCARHDVARYTDEEKQLHYVKCDYPSPQSDTNEVLYHVLPSILASAGMRHYAKLQTSTAPKAHFARERLLITNERVYTVSESIPDSATHAANTTEENPCIGAAWMAFICSRKAQATTLNLFVIISVVLCDNTDPRINNIAINNGTSEVYGYDAGCSLRRSHQRLRASELQTIRDQEHKGLGPTTYKVQALDKPMLGGFAINRLFLKTAQNNAKRSFDLEPHSLYFLPQNESHRQSPTPEPATTATRSLNTLLFCDDDHRTNSYEFYIQVVCDSDLSLYRSLLASIELGTQPEHYHDTITTVTLNCFFEMAAYRSQLATKLATHERFKRYLARHRLKAQFNHRSLQHQTLSLIIKVEHCLTEYITGHLGINYANIQPWHFFLLDEKDEQLLILRATIRTSITELMQYEDTTDAELDDKLTQLKNHGQLKLIQLTRSAANEPLNAHINRLLPELPRLSRDTEDTFRPSAFCEAHLSKLTKLKQHALPFIQAKPLSREQQSNWILTTPSLHDLIRFFYKIINNKTTTVVKKDTQPLILSRLHYVIKILINTACAHSQTQRLAKRGIQKALQNIQQRENRYTQALFTPENYNSRETLLELRAILTRLASPILKQGSKPFTLEPVTIGDAGSEHKTAEHCSHDHTSAASSVTATSSRDIDDDGSELSSARLLAKHGLAVNPEKPVKLERERANATSDNMLREFNQWHVPKNGPPCTIL